MKKSFTFADTSGKQIFGIKWLPDHISPKAVVQISHGMAEHSNRYDKFARFLNKDGFAVYAHDHRGHGETDPDQLGFVDTEDGFQLQVVNVFDFKEVIKQEQPGLPHIMLGHSMGSFLLQRYFQIYEDSPAAIIYSGSNGRPPVLTNAGILLSEFLKNLYGPKKKSTFLHNLMFKPFNNHFKPNRTAADWLSRDQKSVNRYIMDPNCGFISTVSFYNHFLKGIKNIHKEEPFFRHNSNTPILLISGDSDPVSNMGKGVKELEKILINSGAGHVDRKLYTGARHELLHETNNKQVMIDIVKWINQVLPFE